MRKPAHFECGHIVVQRTPYKAQDAGKQGCLNFGRVVWLNGEIPAEVEPHIVTAYVEPLGLVQVKADCLRYSPQVSGRSPAIRAAQTAI